MTDKEELEGKKIAVFAELFNNKYGTDYKVGPAVEENSITDREMISVSGKYSTINTQLKDVIDLDVSELKQSIMGNTKVWDSNIFKLLTPALEKVEKKYGKGAEDVVLVLSVGVSESWMEDYVPPTTLANSSFSAIYCVGLPVSNCPQGYIFSLKEIDKAKLGM